MVIPKEVYERTDCFAHDVNEETGEGRCKVLSDIFCKYERCKYYKKDINDGPNEFCKKAAERQQRENSKSDKILIFTPQEKRENAA